MVIAWRVICLQTSCTWLRVKILMTVLLLNCGHIILTIPFDLSNPTLSIPTLHHRRLSNTRHLKLQREPEQDLVFQREQHHLRIETFWILHARKRRPSITLGEPTSNPDQQWINSIILARFGWINKSFYCNWEVMQYWILARMQCLWFFKLTKFWDWMFVNILN